ncbi:MAG: hypothetical protein MUO26_05690 [Methanotrichaceae archaeon]|nr:hypothetical protein [Methanotrichaceae archaeon]
MARSDFRGRVLSVYFASPAMLQAWADEARNNGLNLSRYIIEMAERGRNKIEKKADRLNKIDQSQEIKKLKEELHIKSKLIDRYETELWNLRHKEYAQENFLGSRAMSAELLKLLKKGGSWPGSDLLDELHIDPSNSEAIKILMGQLKSLAEFGLVTETSIGWKWIK